MIAGLTVFVCATHGSIEIHIWQPTQLVLLLCSQLAHRLLLQMMAAVVVFQKQLLHLAVPIGSPKDGQ